MAGRRNKLNKRNIREIDKGYQPACRVQGTSTYPYSGAYVRCRPATTPHAGQAPRRLLLSPVLKASLVACTRPLLQPNLSSELRSHATQPRVTPPPRRWRRNGQRALFPQTPPNPVRQL